MNASEGISYEQGADPRLIGQYVSNWWKWVRAGVEMLLYLMRKYEPGSIYGCICDVSFSRLSISSFTHSNHKLAQNPLINGQ